MLSLLADFIPGQVRVQAKNPSATIAFEIDALVLSHTFK